VIREATAEDMDQVYKVLGATQEFHHKSLPHIFSEADGAEVTKESLTELENDDEATIVFVAESDGQIIGAASVSISVFADDPMMKPFRALYINNMSVLSDFKRMGIGEALLDKAHEWGLSKGADSAALNVWEFNTAAVNFYIKHGYETMNRSMWKKLKND
jgi:shikimate dehydrogenase